MNSPEPKKQPSAWEWLKGVGEDLLTAPFVLIEGENLKELWLWWSGLVAAGAAIVTLGGGVLTRQQVVTVTVVVVGGHVGREFLDNRKLRK